MTPLHPVVEHALAHLGLLVYSANFQKLALQPADVLLLSDEELENLIPDKLHRIRFRVLVWEAIKEAFDPMRHGPRRPMPPTNDMSRRNGQPLVHSYVMMASQCFSPYRHIVLKLLRDYALHIELKAQDIVYAQQPNRFNRYFNAIPMPDLRTVDQGEQQFHLGPEDSHRHIVSASNNVWWLHHVPETWFRNKPTADGDIDWFDGEDALDRLPPPSDDGIAAHGQGGGGRLGLAADDRRRVHLEREVGRINRSLASDFHDPLQSPLPPSMQASPYLQPPFMDLHAHHPHYQNHPPGPRSPSCLSQQQTRRGVAGGRFAVYQLADEDTAVFFLRKGRVTVAYKDRDTIALLQQQQLQQQQLQQQQFQQQPQQQQPQLQNVRGYDRQSYMDGGMMTNSKDPGDYLFPDEVFSRAHKAKMELQRMGGYHANDSGQQEQLRLLEQQQQYQQQQQLRSKQYQRHQLGSFKDPAFSNFQYHPPPPVLQQPALESAHGNSSASNMQQAMSFKPMVGGVDDYEDDFDI